MIYHYCNYRVDWLCITTVAFFPMNFTKTWEIFCFSLWTEIALDRDVHRHFLAAGSSRVICPLTSGWLRPLATTKILFSFEIKVLGLVNQRFMSEKYLKLESNQLPCVNVCYQDQVNGDVNDKRIGENEQKQNDELPSQELTGTDQNQSISSVFHFRTLI